MRRIVFVVLTVFLLLFPNYIYALEKNLDVTLSVPARSSDLINNLSAQNSPNTSPNSTVNFKISYGNKLGYTDDYTLSVKWTTASPETGPSIDVLEYVPNSAGNAYGNSSPIIDAVNKKITWNISQMPGNIDREVSFSLKAKNIVNGTTKLNYTIASTLQTGPTKLDSNVSGYYREINPPTVTSTPTPTKKLTPTPSAIVTKTPTPTPTPSTISFSITGFSISSVLSNSATLNISTNFPSGAALFFGNSPGNLSSKQVDPSLSRSHSFSISGLSPSTVYYVQIKTISEKGESKNSDTISFKTAKASIAPEVDLTSVVVSSNNNILLSDLNASGSAQLASSSKNQSKTVEKPVVVMPVSKPYEFTFSLQGRQSVKSVRAVLKTKIKKTKVKLSDSSVSKMLSPLGLKLDKKNQVLGIADVADAAEEVDNVEIIEIQPGVYKGRLLGQPKPGDYELFIEIIDDSGNIVQQKIADVKVTKPFMVFSKGGKEPLEGVKVRLYIYIPSKKTYELLTAGTIVIDNPAYSKSDGSVDFVLPAGKYKAILSNLLYKDKTVYFTISQDGKTDYPQIYLTHEGFNPIKSAEYYLSAIYDLAYTIGGVISEASATQRFYNLSNLIVVLMFVIVLIHYFSEKTREPLYLLPQYAVRYVVSVFKKSNKLIVVKGKVFDSESKSPVFGAEVFLVDSENRIKSRTVTNSKGEFSFKKEGGKTHFIQILKENYKEFSINEPDVQKENEPYHFYIQKEEKLNIAGSGRKIFGRLLSVAFGGFLIFAVFFEFCLFWRFPITKVMPYLLLSIITLVIWLKHMTLTRGRF